MCQSISHLRRNQTNHLSTVEVHRVHLLNRHVVPHAKEVLQEQGRPAAPELAVTHNRDSVA